MGRKPIPGLREAILAEAAAKPSSVSMLREAIETKYGTPAPSLTGLIKAAEGLRDAGLLTASQQMPKVYHGARPRTYYETTPKGTSALKDAIASATAGWDGRRQTTAAPAAEGDANESKPKRQRKKHQRKT